MAPFRIIFLPHLQSQVEMHQSKVTAKSELLFRNVAYLLRCLLGQMTLAELHDMLSEVLATVIEPVLRVLVSVHSVFTPLARPELTRQYADLLLCICRTIGREGSKELLLQSLQLFFSAFDWMHATPVPGGGPPAPQHSERVTGGVGGIGGDGAPDLSVLAEAFDAEMAAYTCVASSLFRTVAPALHCTLPTSFLC
jgi:hypothetical protein